MSSSELYDHETDPGEQHNIARFPSRAVITARIVLTKMGINDFLRFIMKDRIVGPVDVSETDQGSHRSLHQRRKYRTATLTGPHRQGFPRIYRIYKMWYTTNVQLRERRSTKDMARNLLE